MTAHNPTPHAGRLESLDILRGFDLFLLLFLQPVIMAVAATGHPEWLEPALRQLDHEVWEGLRCWDLVMPLFLFMTGAAMPFSLSRYRKSEGGIDRRVYGKIARRWAVLFILGMVVQGNLLGFDPDNIFVYTNTLQAIATGYAASALILLHFNRRGQLISLAGLLAVYSLPMALTGDYSPEGNFAYKVDEAVLGRLRGDLTYTWIWSSLTFTATVLMGALAGSMMKGAGERRARVAATLALTGAALVAAGWLASPLQPVIKRIWTASMTLVSGGWCFLLMALFYYVIDVKGHARGLKWLKIYGMNSILAYMLGEAVNFRSIAESLSYGLRPLTGDYYDAWLTFANFLIIFLILAFLYRHKIFIKI